MRRGAETNEDAEEKAVHEVQTSALFGLNLCNGGCVNGRPRAFPGDRYVSQAVLACFL